MIKQEVIQSQVEKPLFQIALAVANAVGSALLFRESKGENPVYGLAAGALLLFTTYHIYMAISLSAEKA